MLLSVWKKCVRSGSMYKVVALALGSLCALGLVGCGDVPVYVNSGSYEFKPNIDQSSEIRNVWSGAKAEVDAKAGTLKLTLGDGTSKMFSMQTVPQSEWPQGCPGNYSSDLMEIRTFQEPLSIGSFTMKETYVISQCGSIYGTPTGFVITDQDPRKDNSLGGPCVQGSLCLYFDKPCGADKTNCIEQ